MPGAASKDDEVLLDAALDAASREYRFSTAKEIVADLRNTLLHDASAERYEIVAPLLSKVISAYITHRKEGDSHDDAAVKSKAAVMGTSPAEASAPAPGPEAAGRGGAAVLVAPSPETVNPGEGETVLVAEDAPASQPPTASLGHVIGDPIAAVVPPGVCYFGEDFSPAPLVSKVQISPNTAVYTFGLDGDKALGLSTCACILAKGGQDKDGKPVIRPYTPISTNAMVGKFELMVRGCFFRNPNPTQHRIRQSSHQ